MGFALGENVKPGILEGYSGWPLAKSQVENRLLAPNLPDL